MTKAQLNRQIVKTHGEACKLWAILQETRDPSDPARMAAHELASKALDLWGLANSSQETKR